MHCCAGVLTALIPKRDLGGVIPCGDFSAGRAQPGRAWGV